MYYITGKLIYALIIFTVFKHIMCPCVSFSISQIAACLYKLGIEVCPASLPKKHF